MIHVAGTKGKGSTCAFTESFLRSHGRRTGFPRKTGLYTSPHLRSINERIRINFEPLSNATFGQYFFEVYDRLCSDGLEQRHGSPRYLQLLALVGFHAFIRERVDVAILETHHGGEFDATNIVELPCVTAISSLGMDHINQLGPTIENIAWHKSGIFKRGTPAVSATQPQETVKVLEQRAADKGAPLTFVDVNKSLADGTNLFQSEVQLINASLALSASREFLKQKQAPDLAAEDIREGVDRFSWPGRFQTVLDETTTWFLDSAHNEISVDKAARWFTKSSRRTEAQTISRVLIYSQISDQRDSEGVLRLLAKTLNDEEANIRHVIFTTYVKSAVKTNGTPSFQTSGGPFTAEDLEKYCSIWAERHAHTEISYEPLIERAIELARSLEMNCQIKHVLITGSQYLVGGALDILEGKDSSDDI